LRLPIKVIAGSLEPRRGRDESHVARGQTQPAPTYGLA